MKSKMKECFFPIDYEQLLDIKCLISYWIINCFKKHRRISLVKFQNQGKVWLNLFLSIKMVFILMVEVAINNCQMQLRERLIREKLP